MNWKRIICWMRGPKWVTKKNERFCLRCGRRQKRRIGGPWRDVPRD